jgi:hypothetical protein
MTEPSGGGGCVLAVLPARTWKDYDSRWRMMVIAVVSGPPLGDRSICDVDVAESTQEHREFIAWCTQSVRHSTHASSCRPTSERSFQVRPVSIPEGLRLSYSCPRPTRSPMILWPQASEERTRPRASWTAQRVGDEVFIADKLQALRKVDPGTDVAPIALDSFFECVPNPEVALRAQRARFVSEERRDNRPWVPQHEDDGAFREEILQFASVRGMARQAPEVGHVDRRIGSHDPVLSGGAVPLSGASSAQQVPATSNRLP